MHVITNTTINVTSIENSTDINCETLQDALYTYNALSIFAVFILVFLSFFEKRRSFATDVCWGRPGCLIPVNLLDDNHGDTLDSAAVFGTTMYGVYKLFTDTNINANGPWLYPLVLLARVIDLGLQYYPLFVCIQYRRNLVVAFTGICYGVLFLFLFMSEIITCSNNETRFMQIPILLCLLYLDLKLTFNFAYSVILKLRPDTCKLQESNTYQYMEYVTSLLHPQTTETEEATRISTMINKVLQLFRCCHERRCICWISMRLLSMYIVASMLLYEWLVLSFTFGHNITKLLRQILAATISNNSQYLKDFTDVFNVTFYGSVVLSSAVTITSMVLLYRNHQRHIRMLLKGDESFIPPTCKSMKPNWILGRSLTFTGSEIGHLIYSYFVCLFLLIALGFAISYLVILPLLDRVPKQFLYPLQAILPGIVVTQLTKLILYLVSGIFLQKRNVHKNGEVKLESILALTNRRAFHNVSYFLFFFYIPLGLFKTLSRNVFSLLCGLLFLGRLDRCIFMPGLENQDLGFMSYIAFLKVEVAHCNPTVLTFCHLLIQGIASTQIESITSSSKELVEPDVEGFSDSSIALSTAARKRWRKCYTLLNNPALCELSKRYVEKESISSTDEK